MVGKGGKGESQTAADYWAIVMGWVKVLCAKMEKTGRWAGFVGGYGGGEELTSWSYFQAQIH